MSLDLICIFMFYLLLSFRWHGPLAREDVVPVFSGTHSNQEAKGAELGLERTKGQLFNYINLSCVEKE